MMRWSAKYKFSSFIVFCLVAIAFIVACNLWSLYWGHCAIHDFLNIPLMGWAVIVANLAAALALSLIKRHNNMEKDGTHCTSCQSGSQDSWVYCPNCGVEYPV